MNPFVPFFVFLVLLLPGGAYAGDHLVTAKGSCAIEGLTAGQAQILALRRARSAAVEQAAGVHVTSSTLVTDGRLAGDFIKSFSRGYIVKETVTWLDMGQYRPDPSRPPIGEYRVEIKAVVSLPEKRRPVLGLFAKINQHVYRAHTEPLTIEVMTASPARIAVFNITAADMVVMLYPDINRPVVESGDGDAVILPPKEVEKLLLATLPGHKRDTEALLIAALPEDSEFRWSDAFVEGLPVPLTTFFKSYSFVAPHCEDTILSYEVFTE